MPDLHPDSCEECRPVPEPLGTGWARAKRQRAEAQARAEIIHMLCDRRDVTMTLEIIDLRKVIDRG